MTTYYRTDSHYAAISNIGLFNATVVFPNKSNPSITTRVMNSDEARSEGYLEITEADFREAYILASVQLARKAGIDLAQVRKEVEV